GVPDHALSGKLSTDMEFGPESNQVKDMMDAPGVNEAREYFREKNANYLAKEQYKGLQNVDSYQGKWGPWEIFLATLALDPTEHFIGRYDINICSNGDGTMTFILKNPTSFKSFLYGIGPEWERSTFTAGGNFYQTLTWTEEIQP
ncbi:MAG: hypothetical protein ACYS0H_25025, partial [Planctomycetota bacterium]